MYQDKQTYGLSGAAGMGYLGAPTPEAIGKRQPEVVTEMERLQKEVELLGRTVETLLGRISPVLSQCKNTANCEQTCAPDPVLCSVADRIRAERKQLERMQADMQRALDELEI